MIVLVFRITEAEIRKLRASGRGGKSYKSFRLAQAAVGREFKDAEVIEKGDNFEVIKSKNGQVLFMVDVQSFALNTLENSPFFQVYQVMDT